MSTPEQRPLNIAVAYNRFEPVPGRSNESVSESSVALEAADVVDALSATAHRVFPLVLGQSLTGFIRRLRLQQTDAVINLCEGFRGRSRWESGLAAFLEMSSIPFTGNAEPAMVLCLDKFKCKAVLAACGLPVPAGWLARSPDAEIPDSIPYPVIVKPNREDASLGINAGSVIRDASSLKKRIRSVIRRYRQPALVEAFIPHREFNAAVWEKSRGPEVLAVQEIDFSSMPSGEPRICGYEAKWFEDHPLYRSTVPVCPAPLDPAAQRKIESISLEAFQALGCRDYARVDFRMDAEGKLYVLEVNPNPDVSRSAGFARALEFAGIDYTDFWLALIRRALTRKETE